MKRKELIDKVVSDLNAFKGSELESQRYPLEENLIFFNATRSIWRYISWLLFHASTIRRSELLELSDFPFPEWDRELHTRLIAMEKKKIPGMITPLCDEIVAFILEKHPKFVMDFGSGGMEVERQVINRLKEKKYPDKICFIGVDFSLMAHEIAQDNLTSLVDSIVDFHKVEQLTPTGLDHAFSNSKHQYQIITCRNDIFKLRDVFPSKSIDLIFYSKFKHHFNVEQKHILDKVTTALAQVVMEYDDYRSWPLFIPQSIAAWKYPVLLNGAIFSRLRDYSKQELRSQTNYSSLKFFPIGSYLKIYK